MVKNSQQKGEFCRKEAFSLYILTEQLKALKILTLDNISFAYICAVYKHI